MVWNRSRESTWSAATPSPATPIISMKSMKPWVALPGVCRLSRVTSAQAALEVAAGDPVDGLAVELGVGAVRAELARPAELQRQVAGADDRHPPVVGPRLDELPDRPAQLDEPLRLRQRRGEDVGVDRHDRQVVLRPQRDDRAGDAVVDAQLVAEGQVEAGVEAVAQDVLRRGPPRPPGSSAAGRTRAPRCTSWRRRRAPCRPGTAACCPATAGGSGRCRPSPARRGRARVSVSRKVSILLTHSSANGGRSAPVDVLAR